MHFVGKILVVLQLVLSIFFMAFAGALYSTQMKWRDHAMNQKKVLEAEIAKLKDSEAELKLSARNLDAEVKKANREKEVVEAQYKTLNDDVVARLTKENADKSILASSSGEQAQIAGEE